MVPKNNPDDFSILTRRMSEHFGFTETEVEGLAEDMGLSSQNMAAIRDWYNGYLIGGRVIYNPWSIIKYADKPEDGLKPYWINTSGNQLLKRLFFLGKNIY